MRNPLNVNLLLLLGCLIPLPAWAAGAGMVTHLGGVLNVTRADGSKKLLSIRSEVHQGDTLRTEKDTYARIRFTDGGEVVLRPETIFKIERYRYSPVPVDAKQDGFMMRLMKGGLRAVTGMIGKRDQSRVKMRAGTATIGIRGTHWGVMCVGEDTCSSQDDAADDDSFDVWGGGESVGTVPLAENEADQAAANETISSGGAGQAGHDQTRSDGQ